MTQLYAALAGVLLLVVAFFYGKHVQEDQDAARNLKALIKANATVAQSDARTLTRSLAAATHVQAAHAAGDALQKAIAHTTFTAHVTEDTHADTKPGTPAAALCSDPFADPHFRVFYDAGSRAGAASPEAPDLPLARTGDSAAPAGGIRGTGTGG